MEVSAPSLLPSTSSLLAFFSSPLSLFSLLTWPHTWLLQQLSSFQHNHQHILDLERASHDIDILATEHYRLETYLAALTAVFGDTASFSAVSPVRMQGLLSDKAKVRPCLLLSPSACCVDANVVLLHSCPCSCVMAEAVVPAWCGPPDGRVCVHLPPLQQAAALLCCP